MDPTAVKLPLSVKATPTRPPVNMAGRETEIAPDSNFRWVIGKISVVRILRRMKFNNELVLSAGVNLRLCNCCPGGNTA